MKNDSPEELNDSNVVSRKLMDLISNIPDSKEPKSSTPAERAKSIANIAAIKSASISGALALPPGPLGMATILPDLFAIWKIQQDMVADIAAAFGKTACLNKQTMIYCLFKHGGAAIMRDIVVRVGERVLIKRAALRVIQQLLQKIGIRITQRAIGKGISRWLPIIGAVGIAGYAYYDTTQVASTAIELFSREIILEDDNGLDDELVQVSPID